MKLPLLRADGLRKRYGGRVVFDGLSFSYGPGAVALTGPNGAGKSTLLHLLAGIETPDAGRIEYAGVDLLRRPAAAKALLSYVPDEPAAYDFMSGAELLQLAAALRGVAIADADRARLQRFGIAHAVAQPFGGMSLGTQRKFMLVAGLLGDPCVVLLDEPTNGLDTDARAALTALVNEQRARRLFLFSTHDQALIAATGAEILPLGQSIS
jgi:ABC-2 type transport system ATP-binding protein